MGRADDLMNQRQHLITLFEKQSVEIVAKNRRRLIVSIWCIQWLAFQGCPFRGNNESKNSKNRGNFLELVNFSAKLNNDISEVVLDNAQGNAKYISPAIQKEILNIFAVKVREKIRKDIGNAKFCILVDESKDNSGIEQMATVVRYVDKEGNVQEHFFDVQRVDNVCSLTLKNGIMNVFTRFDLQVQNLRGQGYDGANNIRGAMNGLQALFLKDCPYAYYVHCFAHRLQLALEKAAKNNGNVWSFYFMLNSIITLVTASSRRTSDFQSAQEEDTPTKIQNGDLETGKGANQVGTLRRASDTRWSSHYNSACSLIRLFDPTCMLIRKLGTCESVELFCEKHDIHMPDMKARHLIGTGRSCQQVDNITEEHHHRVNIFNAAIGVQLVELKIRFPEDTMELLILSAALDPRDSFRRFKIEDICMLTEKFYPADFSNQDIHILRISWSIMKLSHSSF